MSSSPHFRINTPNVILETFDDEVVIVNLDNGNYYSADKVGMDIWAHIEAGASLAETAQRICQHYEGDPGEIEGAVTKFANELKDEALIIELETAAPPQPEPATVSTTADRKPFELPVLNKYTDMQDLLLLDPIHEVDETGWPNMAPPGN